jgi:hypothetical protein
LITGLAIGLRATLLLLSHFGVQPGVADPFDPASLAGACLVLFLSGITACLAPAMRAACTEPSQALRLD